jgi:hypothetical protein
MLIRDFFYHKLILVLMLELALSRIVYHTCRQPHTFLSFPKKIKNPPDKIWKQDRSHGRMTIVHINFSKAISDIFKKGRSAVQS